MTPRQLAEFFALLSILEPDSVTCRLAARLAAAGTATAGETDTAVLKELREHAARIAEELRALSEPQLARKAALVARLLAADDDAHAADAQRA